MSDIFYDGSTRKTYNHILPEQEADDFAMKLLMPKDKVDFLMNHKDI